MMRKRGAARAKPNGRHSSITRARIIEIAAEIFQRRGFRGTGLADIARRLGVTKPALYHHIRSKDDLLSAIYSQTAELMLERVGRVVASNLPVAEKFAALVEAHVVGVAESLPLFAVSFNEWTQLSAASRRALDARRRTYLDFFERVYLDGVAAGVFRKLDAKLVVFAILGMGNSICHWFQPGGRCTAETVTHVIAEIASGGYRESHEPDAVPRSVTA